MHIWGSVLQALLTWAALLTSVGLFEWIRARVELWLETFFYFLNLTSAHIVWSLLGIILAAIYGMTALQGSHCSRLSLIYKNTNISIFVKWNIFINFPLIWNLLKSWIYVLLLLLFLLCSIFLTFNFAKFLLYFWAKNLQTLPLQTVE